MLTKKRINQSVKNKLQQMIELEKEITSELIEQGRGDLVYMFDENNGVQLAVQLMGLFICECGDISEFKTCEYCTRQRTDAYGFIIGEDIDDD